MTFFYVNFCSVLVNQYKFFLTDKRSYAIPPFIINKQVERSATENTYSQTKANSNKQQKKKM